MPVHDWTRVDAGTYHDFHNAWIVEIRNVLNGGLLPEGYYAMSEQHAGRMIADVLTLRGGEGTRLPPAEQRGPVAVADAPPRVSRKMVAGPRATYRAKRRTLAIRHVTHHQLVALIEILSPGNKDRASSVKDVVEKTHAALRQGLHLLMVDLFPPGRHDPQGMHGAIWESFDSEEEYMPLPSKPLTLVAYVADKIPEAYIESVAVGDPLPDMPLFLQTDWYVNVPFESTYQAAYRGVPAIWRSVLEGREAPTN